MQLYSSQSLQNHYKNICPNTIINKVKNFKLKHDAKKTKKNKKYNANQYF